MKKFIFTIAALVLGISQMSAQRLVFEDVDLPLGGQATLTVKYETGGESLTTASFTLNLPDGVSSEKTSAGKSKFVVNADMAESFSAYTTDKDGFSVAATATGVEFPGTSGVLGTVTLIAAADAANLKIGESYPVTVTGVSLVKRTDAGLVSIYFDDIDIKFNVNIVENRITLDENVGVTSETPTGEQNVLVKRTINAGNWSTICLPFAMTSAQVATAFGEKVKIAEFTGCETENNEEDEAVSIKINFESKSDKSIEANHPYIILIDKSDDSITEFEVDGVTIEPSEELSVDMNEYITGSGTKKDPYVYHYNSFVGTYNAETVLTDEDILFISGNKFYYSNGTTTMKAFRGYFEFYDVLADKNVSAAKIGYSVDDETTSIDGISGYQIVEGVYDLSGRKIQLEDNDLNKLQKGVYIIDGKKVTIK